MSDQLYLSLWYPNFRLDSLPAALIGVLRQFALIAKDGQPTSALGRVAAASVYPIDWTESPTYQRIYVNDDRSENSSDTEGSIIENAVAEATEQLHDDCAYEFEMRWMLWLPDPDAGEQGFDTAWHLEPARVRITGFGPDFDRATYDQNGHIRVDFGLDTPWVLTRPCSIEQHPGPHSAERPESPRLHPQRREALRHLQPPPLDRKRRTPRRKAHRPPSAPELKSSALSHRHDGSGCSAG
jgi:hypothetical protein